VGPMCEKCRGQVGCITFLVCFGLLNLGMDSIPIRTDTNSDVTITIF
jgi:hypothetical protein